MAVERPLSELTSAPEAGGGENGLTALESDLHALQPPPYETEPLPSSEFDRAPKAQETRSSLELNEEPSRFGERESSLENTFPLTPESFPSVSQESAVQRARRKIWVGTRYIAPLAGGSERSDDPFEETPEERDARRRRMIDRLDEYFSTRQNDENPPSSARETKQEDH